MPQGERLGRVICACAIALWALGCAQVDRIAIRDRATRDAASNDGGRADGGDAGHDAGNPDDDGGNAADSGRDTGVAEDAGDGGGSCPYRSQAPDGGAVALDALVAHGLGHALCSCEAIALSAALQTDAFDGANGPYTQGEPGGDVGANREMSVEGTSNVRGALAIAGNGGLTLGDGAELDVGSDLGVGGPLEGSMARVRVAGDAAVAGRIVLDALSVTGELVQPAGTERVLNDASGVQTVRSAAVQVEPPCDCAQASLLDTAALVRDAAAQAMALQSAAPVLDMACGQYTLAVAPAGDLHIVAHRSGALYVPGDLTVHGDLIVDTDPGAELDLFVEVNISIDGRVQLGTQAGQGAVRVYAGGSGTLQLGAGGELHGVLYAPGAELVLSGPLDVQGAVFVRRAASTAELTVHYDRSLGR